MKRAVSIKRVAALAATGLCQSEISRRLGVSHQRVSQIVKKHGIECARLSKRAMPETRSERIRRLKAECGGMTATEAAKHLGVDTATVRNDESASGFDGLAQTKRRTRSDQTKRILKEAPALAARGLSKTEAARELGVSPPLFMVKLARYLSDLQWRDGREDGKSRRSKGWTKAATQERRERLRSECHGMSISEAARHLRVSKDTVSADARATKFDGLIVRVRSTKLETQDRRERLVGECVGMTTIQAANHLGVPLSIVLADRRATGFKFVRTTSEKMRARRKRMASECRGMTAQEAASHMGTSVHSVRKDGYAIGFKFARARPNAAKRRTTG